MNREAITLEDCLVNYEVNQLAAIINDGKVVRFEEAEHTPLNTTYIIFSDENLV